VEIVPCKQELRFGNKVAHSLARCAQHIENASAWIEDVLRFLEKFVYVDVIQTNK